MLYAGDLNWAVRLLPLDAVALALPLMVTDQRTEHAHRIVVEKQRSGVIQIPFQKKPDHLGNIRLHRAAVLAAGRFLALQATPRLSDNMDCHFLTSS